MEELKIHLLTKYDNIIEELEEVDSLCMSILLEATSKNNYTETDISKHSIFARDNSRRHQFARAERNLIKTY